MIDAISVTAIRKIGYHLRMTIPSALVRLRGRLHPVEHVLDEIIEDSGVELVDDLLTLSLGNDQPRISKLAEVARDGRPCRGKMIGNLARRARPVAQQAQDLAACRIGEGLEGGVHDGSYCVLS